VKPRDLDERLLFVIRQQEFRVQRHLYEWTIMAENRWPHAGRKLTSVAKLVSVSVLVSGRRPRQAGEADVGRPLSQAAVECKVDHYQEWPMSNQIATDTFKKELLDLLEETFEQVQGIYLVG